MAISSVAVFLGAVLSILSRAPAVLACLDDYSIYRYVHILNTYIYIYIYVYIYIYTSLSLYIYIYTYTYISIHLSLSLYIKPKVHPAGRRAPWHADLRSTAASSTDALLEILQLIIMRVLTTVREIRKQIFKPEVGSVLVPLRQAKM